MARIGAVEYFAGFQRLSRQASMKKLLLLLASALLVATASLALDRSQLSASGPALAAEDRAAQTPGSVDAEMQAICREVLVDIDQGYGVSSHESRYICGDKDH
jgi:hypothetical protein